MIIPIFIYQPNDLSIFIEINTDTNFIDSFSAFTSLALTSSTILPLHLCGLLNLGFIFKFFLFFLSFNSVQDIVNNALQTFLYIHL